MDHFGAATVDTRLLVLFEQLYRTQNLTRAAEQLGLSQPTVSIWLAKLRRQLHDPLFIRTASGMRPTVRADGLIGPTREVLLLLRQLAGGDGAFDPATTERRFRVSMTDASHITLLPRLFGHLRAVAPRARLEVLPISAATGRALEAGEADLALGFVPGMDGAFFEQALYEQDFICLVSPDHPRIGDRLSIEDYRREGHIGILSLSSYTMLQPALKAVHIDRRIELELPAVLGLTAIVSSTDLIATVPRHIGETLAESGAVRAFRCPLNLPTFMVKQYWHARYHQDQGNRWLRAACASLFLKRSRGEAEAR